MGRPLLAVAKRIVKPVATSGPSKALWRQRFHWPVLSLGAAVLAAGVLGPVITAPTKVSSHLAQGTLPASAWPGLLHQQLDVPTPAASGPSTLVPACAGSGSPAVAASHHVEGGGDPSAQVTTTSHRIVLDALLAPTPVVTSVTPSSGPLLGGTSVTIDGSGFSGATVVLFGVVAALLFSVSSDGQITATSPPGVGTVDVRVLTLGGTSATSAADQFSYVAPAPIASAPPTTLPGAPATGGSGTGSGAGSGAAGGSSSGPGSGAGTPGGTGGTASASGSGGASAQRSPLGSTVPTPTIPGAAGLGTIDGGVIPTPGSSAVDGSLGCGLLDSATGNPVGGETSLQYKAVQLALSLIGTPYVWGGESTRGFDCSGLVQFVFSSVGVQLPRTAQTQYDAGPAVAPGQTVVPGDLVFFGSGPQDVGHVGIFVGNGVMVDAPHTGADVRLDQINGFEPVVGVTSPGD